MAHPFYHSDPFAVTLRAGVAFKDDYAVRSSVRAHKFSMMLIDCFEMLMGSEKNLFSLVIEISALNNAFEIFQCVLSGTKHLPTPEVRS